MAENDDSKKEAPKSTGKATDTQKKYDGGPIPRRPKK